MPESKKRTQSQAVSADALRRAAQSAQRLADTLNELLPRSTARNPLELLLTDPRERISLHRHVRALTDQAVVRIRNDPAFKSRSTPFSSQELETRIEKYLEDVAELRSAITIGTYWGDEWTATVWTMAMERLGNGVPREDGLVVWLNLRLLPALIASYAGGLAAVAGKKFHNLRAITTDPVIEDQSERGPAVLTLYPGNVLEAEVAHRLPGYDRRLTPVSDWLFEELRPSLADYVSTEEDYVRLFDRYEYLLGLIYADVSRRDWAPIGRFIWRRDRSVRDDIVAIVGQEIDKQGDSWPPLQAGLFGGSTERLTAAKARYDSVVNERTRAVF